MPPTIIEEDGIPPALTDVASVGWRDLPACYVLRVEEIELLMAEDAYELQPIDGLWAAPYTMKLCGFVPHTVSLHLSYLSFHGL